MRKFSSYGPINKRLHYYVSRKELFAKATANLKGEQPEEGGHYITVWSPRQTGKSSLLLDIYHNLLQDDNYIAAYIATQHLRDIDDAVTCLNKIIDRLSSVIKIQIPPVKSTPEFQEIFTAKHLPKPLILIIDEFDSLQENVINDIVGVFRNIHHLRLADTAVSDRKEYLLHGVALIGVRSVMGVENKSGSPFNVQKSLQVHNLTAAEVNEMYHWYEEETGQTIEQEVIDRVFYVTQGQPGLVSWFGELLTGEYNDRPGQPLTMNEWNKVYNRALQVLPNNNIINIISKAIGAEYRNTVLHLFRIDHKERFEFENPHLSYLFMHGVISYEEVDDFSYIKFPCPFVQEKLYRHFSGLVGQAHHELLVDPFLDLTTVIDEQTINIKKLLGLYQDYYYANREYLTEYAQRRADLQVMEVVHHFQLFSWLDNFLKGFGSVVLPEFPTGNGKIDLLLRHRGNLYGLELKSFSQLYLLSKNILQASEYGKSLGLAEITLVVFVERPVPVEIRAKYTEPHIFAESATVNVFFLQTGPPPAE